MILINFDQATRLIGWSVFDNDKLIAYGTKDFSNEGNADERIVKIKYWVNEMIDKYKGEIFAIEDIQYENNIKTYRILAELIGVLKENFNENKYLYIIVPSSAWRSTCKIKSKKREQQKQEAIEFVKKQFGLKDVDDNCAEAIAIGFHVINKELPKLTINKSTN